MSDNVMLLHNNEVDRATVTASSAAAAMPITNVQNEQRTVIWRSTAVGSQTIDITLAVDEEQVQAFSLVDHNLTIAGTVQLEAWNDALGGANQVLNTTLQPYKAVYGFGVLPYGEGLYGGYDTYINGLSIADARAVLRPILTEVISPALSVRFWRITINDASINYYQLGRIYLGPAWQPKTNFNWGAKKSRENRTRRLESRGGQFYGNPRTGRTILDFVLSWLDNPDRDQLWIIEMVLGEYKPLILIQKPTGGYKQESSSFYGVFDPIELEQVFLNNSATTIKFLESL